jgi:Rrf2 family transcriptional regulator, iron-sulfur cluster assembly transcription factor
MRLTTKGRYAVTAMVDVALHSAAGPVTLADIAVRQAISQSYLEQLFGRLKRGGLVVSLRGPGGGYALAKPPGEISVSDIIGSVGEGIDATRCGGTGDCQEGLVCLTHELWMDLSERIDQFLSDISLTDLLARADVRAVSRRQDSMTQQSVVRVLS